MSTRSYAEIKCETIDRVQRDCGRLNDQLNAMLILDGEFKLTPKERAAVAKAIVTLQRAFNQVGGIRRHIPAAQWGEVPHA